MDGRAGQSRSGAACSHALALHGVLQVEQLQHAAADGKPASIALSEQLTAAVRAREEAVAALELARVQLGQRDAELASKEAAYTARLQEAVSSTDSEQVGPAWARCQRGL